MKPHGWLWLVVVGCGCCGCCGLLLWFVVWKNSKGQKPASLCLHLVKKTHINLCGGFFFFFNSFLL